MRARLAIAASGVVCELREVVLRNKPQALLDASPKATVPVLVQADGKVIEQSLDIMLWALRRNDPDAWLTPGLSNFPDMLALIAQCDGSFKQNLDRYKYPNRYDLADGIAHRNQAGLWLGELNLRLGNTPFLFGTYVCLADMAIAPFVRQFAHTDLDWFKAQPWPHLQQWLESWMASELFDRVMQKYPAWVAETAGIRFPA